MSIERRPEVYSLDPIEDPISIHEVHDVSSVNNDFGIHDKILINELLETYREKSSFDKKNDDPETRVRIAEYEAEISRRRAERAENREARIRQQLDEALSRISSLTDDVSIAQLLARQAGQKAENAERREMRTSEQLEDVRGQLNASRDENARLRGENDRLRRTRQETTHVSNDPYLAALGIHPDAFLGRSDDQVKAIIEGAYKTFVRIDHPDRGGDTQRMQGVNAAYDHLIKAGNYRFLRR